MFPYFACFKFFTDNTSSPSSIPAISSTPIVEEYNVHIDDENEAGEENEEHPDDSLKETNDGDSSHPFKRARKSDVWKDLEDPIQVGGVWKTKCKHCKVFLSVSKTGTTSHLKRHLNNCFQKKVKLKQQNIINFLPTDSSGGAPLVPGFVSAVHDGQFDKLIFREGMAMWLTATETPFAMVEKLFFNLMIKRIVPQWTSISRGTTTTDTEKIYEKERKKLKDILKDVDRISITTDLWRAKSQKIEYMVVTGHFVDRNWKLQKRVLSFVHLPPPRKGKDIANSIFKCLTKWGIENKVSRLFL
ncbi:hypothetical protein M5689_019258 [Euphorbia peplus]|nr:hypothetical protein M5689_019258 [Euphorbia peplus]